MTPSLADNLLADFSLLSNEQVFINLFPTDCEFEYRRRDRFGNWKHIRPGNYPVPPVYEIASRWSNREDGNDIIGGGYKGPYLYSVMVSKSPEPICNIRFDIDNPNLVPQILNSPLAEHGIWLPSNSPGHWHIDLICTPIDPTKAGNIVSDWLAYNGLQCKGVETSVTGLQSITLPGQSQLNLPCEPGKPKKTLCNSYQETKEFYVNRYFEQAVNIEQVLYVPKAQEKSSNNLPPKIPSFRRKKIVCDIPVIGQSIGCFFNGVRYDFDSAQELKDEHDGFVFSNAFYPAVLRHFRGDKHLAFQAICQHRQDLRPSSSKKNSTRLMVTHVKSMLNWYASRYDESKMKRDEQQEIEDKTALIDFFLRNKRILVKNCQQRIKRNKAEIVGMYGSVFYSKLIRTIPYVISAISRFNGRLARGTKKTTDEYIFANSFCWLDIPTINGSRRTRDRIISCLKSYNVFTDKDDDGNPTAEYVRNKCSRWNVTRSILDETEKRYSHKEKGQKEKPTMVFLSTNIASHVPKEQVEEQDYIGEYAMYAGACIENESDFDKKCSKLQQTMSREQ